MDHSIIEMYSEQRFHAKEQNNILNCNHYRFLEEDSAKNLYEFKFLTKKECNLILTPPCYGKTLTSIQLVSLFLKNQNNSVNYSPLRNIYIQHIFKELRF